MEILDLLKDIEEDIIGWRRYLHENPELGLDLENTSNFVVDRLEEFKIPHKKGVGTDHTVLGLIEGGLAGDTIAFRADMDALAIQEETGLPFAAKNGCMHACGHDAHTAILLGAAQVINQNKENLRGRVLLIFQTAEEISQGARPLAQSGILEEYQVKKIYGLHVGGISGGNESGKLFLNPGPMMSCLDSFKLRVTGQGAHGAYPNKSIDPITTASYIVTGLQEIISREIAPNSPGVISIGSFQAGSSYNVIPDQVEIEGTARAVTQEQREYIARRIGEVSQSIGQAFRAQVDYDYTFGAPPLVNNREITLELMESAQRILGEDKVVMTTEPVMGGEDFAEYLERVPGSFMFFENMMEIDGQIYPHHNPRFALDESKFIYAASIFVQVAFDN